MVEFLKIQYRLGAIDEAYLDKLVSKGKLIKEQKKLILDSSKA